MRAAAALVTFVALLQAALPASADPADALPKPGGDRADRTILGIRNFEPWPLNLGGDLTPDRHAQVYWDRYEWGDKTRRDNKAGMLAEYAASFGAVFGNATHAVTSSWRECLQKCFDINGGSRSQPECMGVSWCGAGPGDFCDGRPPGTCVPKRWDFNGKRRANAYVADVVGCAGPEGGQGWLSTIVAPQVRLRDVPPPCKTAAPPVPGVPGAVRGADWAGEVVALDADFDRQPSWSRYEDAVAALPPAPVASAYGCALACAGARNETTGRTANAFSFCDDPAGCGSGCDARLGSVGVHWPEDKERDPDEPWDAEPKGCVPSAANATAPGPAYARGLCACKWVADVKAPKPASTGGAAAEAAGWVSGPVVQPPAWYAAAVAALEKFVVFARYSSD